MKKGKDFVSVGQVLEQIAQKMINWAFIVSAGIVVWLFNSFDKFKIDGKLPFKWIYAGAFILFSFSMICAACFKISILLQSWTGSLRRFVLNEALQEMKKMKDAPKDQWEPIAKKVTDALEMEGRTLDMSKRFPTLLREGIIYFTGGTLYLIVFLALFFCTYL